MIEKSAQPVGFYELGDPSPGLPDEAAETFESLPATAGPWSPEAQHGGPPAATCGTGGGWSTESRSEKVDGAPPPSTYGSRASSTPS